MCVPAHDDRDYEFAKKFDLPIIPVISPDGNDVDISEKAYTEADLDWRNDKSRSSVEMKDPKARPALKGMMKDLTGYDVVFIGYPIWWDAAPRVINTFIESHDLKGKRLIPFATSGSSGIEESVKALRKSYPDLKWSDGRLLNRASDATIQEWVGKLAL